MSYGLLMHKANPFFAQMQILYVSNNALLCGKDQAKRRDTAAALVPRAKFGRESRGQSLEDYPPAIPPDSASTSGAIYRQQETSDFTLKLLDLKHGFFFTLVYLFIYCNVDC